MNSDDYFLLQVDQNATDVADSYFMTVYEITEDNIESVEDPAILQEIINSIQCNAEDETEEYILPDISKEDLYNFNEIDYIDVYNDDTESTDEEQNIDKAEEKYNNLNETQKKVVDALVQKVMKTSKVTSEKSEIVGVSYIDDTDLLSDDVEKEELVCGNEYIGLKKLAQTLTSADRKKSLRRQLRAFKMPCEICGKMICQANMNMHIMNVHTDEKKYNCKLCSAKFKTARGLSAHTNAHFGIRPFQCDECPKLYTSYTALRAHKMDHQDRIHKCEVCSQAFTRKYSLTEHVRIHSANSAYKCKICGKTLTTASKYRVHVMRHEGLGPVYPCSYCSKRFTKISNMKGHLKKIHNISIVTRKMFFNNLPNMDTVTMEIPSL